MISPHTASTPSRELEDLTTECTDAASTPVETSTEARGTESPTDVRQSGHDCSAADNDALVDAQHPRMSKRTSRGQVGACILLPLLVMLMAAGTGYLKYQDNSVRDAQTAAMSSVQAAKEGTIALLSYTPDTAQATLTAARDRLTGSFRDSYIALTNDVVIPGAKQKRISAAATVPAVATVSANPNRAVVLVFVDQSVVVGNDAPSTTASAVQVTLDKTGDRWLISGFDPK